MMSRSLYGLSGLLLVFFCLTGCATQGCFRYYSKDFVTQALNDIPLDADSNISVISFHGFPSNAVNAYARRLVLGYHEGNQLKIREPSLYQAFQVNRRLYLFNLPPGVYYVLAITPDRCPSQRSSPGAQAFSNSNDLADMRTALQWSEPADIVLDQTNSQYYPLKVIGRQFNLLGEYQLNREMFSERGTMALDQDMDRDKETAYFNGLVKENCKWKTLVRVKPSPGGDDSQP